MTMNMGIRPPKFYLVAVVKGRPYVDGAFDTRDEAQKIGWQKLQGVVWDIVPSDIYDKSAFIQNCKHEIFVGLNNNDGAANIELATRNFRHSIARP